MVEGATALNGGLRHRTVEGKIKSKMGEKGRQVVFLIFFFSSISRDRTNCASSC